MKDNVITKEIDFNGRTLKLETGKLARQADASVVATLGETMILATVTTKPTLEATDHFPLSVEYVEKYYAGGRITGQKFIKREGRPTDKAILSGRAIDRSIRPLFPKDFHSEVQVVISVLSIDGQNDPAQLGYIAVSAALSISSVPFNGPLGFTLVGSKDGKLVFNPIIADREYLDLELSLATTKTTVVMVEAEGLQIKDELVFDAIKQSHAESQKVIDFISEFAKEAGKEKQPYSSVAEVIEEAKLKEIKEAARAAIEKGLFDTEHKWNEATGDKIKSELSAKFVDLTPQLVSGIFDKVAKEIMNDTILNNGKRVDGRAMDQVRPIVGEVGLLPRAHGSALFSRGETQVLSVTTLGPLSLSQTLEGMEGESHKRWIHHYNMGINPFATGEVKRIGSPNRRDTGHGNLVEISLAGVIPSEDEFPYTIRVVSEVLGADASSSQASVCGTTLSLLSAGVPIEPVAGVAMGLLSNDTKFQVITDMKAVEDFYGEMDFKIAGTKNGITGIQMDTKLPGISFEIVEEAIKQGKAAREFIIDEMKKVIPEVGKVSQYAPKVRTLQIEPTEIGMLIGPGGKNINGIIASTGAQVDVEEDGTVMVSSTSEEAIQKAMDAIQGQFKKIAVGEEYDGKVVRLAAFGAFVNILPGKDGLVHVSQMAAGRVENPEDVVHEGQEVHVRVTDVSPEGKVGLSMLFGDDIKPESEGRPSGGGGRPSGGFGEDRGPSRSGYGGGSRGSSFSGGSRGGYSDRGPARSGFNSRPSFGDRSERPASGGFRARPSTGRSSFGPPRDRGSRPSGGFDRRGGGDRGGSRGGSFNR
jgi:polyribonucleotide nucleotidyltransferase